MPDTPVDVTFCSLGAPLESAVTLTLVHAPSAPVAPVAVVSDGSEIEPMATPFGHHGWKDVLNLSAAAPAAATDAPDDDEVSLDELEDLDVFKAPDLVFEFHKRSAMDAASVESAAVGDLPDRLHDTELSTRDTPNALETGEPHPEPWSGYL